jgi:hypothetical protein
MVGAAGHAVNREARIGVAVLALLGAFVFAMLLVGSIGEPRPELERLTVAEVKSGSAPAERYGQEELRIVGWFAELDADCVEEEPPAAVSVPWMERDCPLRVLMPEQPSQDVTQAQLLNAGIVLAARDGRPFPSRAQPDGPNLRLEQLVFVGHFDDPAAADCAPALREHCRSLFVVSDYDGLVR